MSHYPILRLSACKPLQRAWLAALVLLLGAPAHGLSVVNRSFDELVQRADLVLVGTVTQVRSAFAADGLDQNTILSYVDFSDLQVVKGQLSDATYTLRVPGGVVGRFAQDYPGVPAFQTGQRYLVFIRGNNHDFFPVVGVNQGVFRILRNAQGQPVVVRDDRLAQTGRRALTGITQTAPTLDRFIQEVRARLTPAAAGGSPP